MDQTENTVSTVVASLSVATETCLPCHYLATAASSCSTIPAFSHHVTVLQRANIFKWLMDRIRNTCVKYENSMVIEGKKSEWLQILERGYRQGSVLSNMLINMAIMQRITERQDNEIP
jgi:hypothetical protein